MTKTLAMALCVIGLVSGCAYQFQGKKNPLQKVGIQKIYVTSFKNATYRPGVEQLFTTAIIREIQKSRSFTLVNSEKEADAVLSGEVKTADTSINTSVPVILNPAEGRSVNVGSEFAATITCEVKLTDNFGRVLFSRVESGQKVYPGSTNVGDAGATNSLVNDSEQRLAIQFLASQMMSSAYQRMIDTF